MSIENLKIKVLGRLSPDIESSFADILELKGEGNSEVILFCDYSEFDIPVGYCFSEIVKNGIAVQKCKVILRSVSQQFYKSFDEIPHGWKTVSKFEFPEGIIPAEVKQLRTLNGWVHVEESLIFQ